MAHFFQNQWAMGPMFSKYWQISENDANFNVTWLNEYNKKVTKMLLFFCFHLYKNRYKYSYFEDSLKGWRNMNPTPSTRESLRIYGNLSLNSVEPCNYMSTFNKQLKFNTFYFQSKTI